MAKKSRPSMLNKLWNPRGKSARRRVALRSRPQLGIESLEDRRLMATFQHGVGGYLGTQDTVLYSISPNVNFGAETGISVDQQDVAGVRQGLLRFDNIFGSGAGQIPLGSTIDSATLRFEVFNDSNAAMQMSFYRMRTTWDQNTATWNSFGQIGGVQASEGEAESLPPDGVIYDATTGVKTVDVTTSLRHWATGEPNFGWLIESAATNGWDFNTSEGASANRPVLTVNFTPPSGAGSFQFLNLKPSAAEGSSGGPTTVNLSIARVGGTAGAASVDFTVAAGGANAATAGVDFVAAGPTTVNFAAGQATATIQVQLTGDTALEGLETLSVSLSNAAGGASINGSASTATLTIADDDALINEVLANITNSTTDETDREYIELIGTPGASLNGYYFVGFEGEEEENSGVADIVIDLAGQTFGANGLLVITPTAWAYQSLKDPQTNQLTTTRLDGVGGRIEDSSQTFALVRSTTALVETTDYDTVGAYASGLATALSSDDLEGVIEGLGILDTGPFAPGGGGQIVDVVGVVEGGGNDRDRVLTTREANHPGVHVHQPDGFGSGNSNATSDAVSRRFGQSTPSTIGVWFNGDIPDGTGSPIAYPAGTSGGRTPVSVVAPGGAVITPGSLNVLRNVFFDITAKEVDESAGMVTLTVRRSGDTSQAITVAYATQNGTAVAGQDFTATNGVLNFAVGDNSEDVVVPINATDGFAEGFENFSVRLTSATNPFLVTLGTALVTIADGDVETATFQQNDANGYVGTKDTILNSIQPNDNFGIGTTVIVDEQAGTLTGPDARPAQGLLRFDDLFGANPGQIPVGSQIFSGFITVNVVNPSAGDAKIRFFPMLQNWEEFSSTWSDPQGAAGAGIVNGVTPDGSEAGLEAELVLNPGQAGLVDVPVSRELLQAWANGSATNLGWSIVNNTGDDWAFASSDSILSPPKLTVLYTSPSGAGTFGFANDQFVVNESGGNATVTVHRVGGSTGAVNVDWTLGLGTAAAGDFSGPTAGTLTFAAGELSKTFTVPIVNDNQLEANETLNLTLSGAGVALDPSATTTTLLIRDNDLSPTSPAVLLSEILINSPGLDSRAEFVELAGTPGAGLGSLYVVVINGDVGEGEGSTDLVVDLGQFANGANGTTVVTASDAWQHRVHSGTTQVARPELNDEIIANDTATYALVYSPSTPLHLGNFDYDWDNDGSLDLPTGAIIVDSVGNKDNGALDQTYGPSSNVILSQLHPNLFVADAISRLRGNTTRNNASAWFRGDLTSVSSTADDMLVYDATNSAGLPVAGAALTPGEINVGTAAQSPLVSLVSVTPNLPVGTVTLTFNGPISQVPDAGGFIGVFITDTSGNVVPGVDPAPVITGFETNTLTLNFTGSAVVAGQLPSGQYQLNFAGNSLIGNGRAVDAANVGSPTGSNFEVEFAQTSITNPADYSLDGFVDGADILKWQRQLGNVAPANLDSDGDDSNAVDAGDEVVWRNNFPAAEPAGVASGVSSSQSALEAVFASGDVTNFFTEARGYRPLRRRVLA